MNSANDGVVPQAGREFSQVETLTHQLNIDKKDFLKMIYVMKDESFEKKFEIDDKFYKQEKNDGGGYAFPVSDMTLLNRFLVLGYQYICPKNQEDDRERPDGELPEKEKRKKNQEDDRERPGGELLEKEKRKKKREEREDEVRNCVMRLINNGQYTDVLNLIEKLSAGGRGIKDDAFLFVLSLLVAVKPKGHGVYKNNKKTNEAQAYDEAYKRANPDKDLIKIKKEYKEANAYDAQLRKAAYEKVNTICNIPTKLFRLIDMSQTLIKRVRETHPPVPQKKKKTEGKTVKEPKEDDETSIDSGMKKVHTKVKRGGMAWGRQRRKAIAKFYTDENKDPVKLLYLLTKYKKRHGWSHIQVMKYAHPKIHPGSNRDATRLVLMYCSSSKGYKKVKEEVEKLERSVEVEKLMKHIEILDEVQNMKGNNENNKKRLIEILQRHGFRGNDDESDNDLPATLTGENERKIIVREHIPTEFLNDVEIWEALLKDMPMTAMIRNLTKMASLGMFDERKGNEREKNIERNIVCVEKALSDTKRLKKARIHPIKILLAKEMYEKGTRGESPKPRNPSRTKYCKNPRITDALNSAFYNCFQKAEIAEDYKSGKKFMLFLDLSSFKEADDHYKLAATAMIMKIWNVEENVEIIGYHTECSDLKEILKKNMTIDEAINALNVGEERIATNDTDNVAPEIVPIDGSENENAGNRENMANNRRVKDIPIRYAFQKRIEVDCFIVFTCSNLDDVEIPHVIALRIYNHTMQRKAKLVVCEMSFSKFSIAIGDSKDPNCLDIVGFDSHAPEIIQRFAKHDIVIS